MFHLDRHRDPRPERRTNMADEPKVIPDAACGTDMSTLLRRGLHDLKTVFFYPLCIGICTGVGFTVGKRLGENYFYGGARIR